MDEKELHQHLESEYRAYIASLKSDAELAFGALTMEEFFELRREEFDDSLEKPRLKPCPFCEGEPKLSVGAILDTIWCQVQCRCGVCGPTFMDHRHLAVQGWNKICRREPCS